MESAKNQRLREYVALACIILLAVVVRFYDLSLLPPGLWYDEAINGLDALSILHEKNLPIFFTTEQHPREPLFIYLIAVAFKLFGVSKEILRGSAGVIGVGTVVIVYVFVKELGRGAGLAFLSALMFAVLRWHIQFSRESFRTILAPLLVTVCFLFFLRALRAHRTRDYALTGFFLGLGFYSYLSFRFVPLIFLCVLLFLYLRRRTLAPAVRMPEGRQLLILLIIALIVFSPLMVDYLMNPWHFFGRAGEVTLFSKGFVAGVKAVASQAWQVALMFSFKGDHVSKHNIPYVPVFGHFLTPLRSVGEVSAAKGFSAPLVGFALIVALLIASHSVFFYAGLVRAILRVRTDVGSLLLVCWFFFMLLTTILSYGAPNLLRALVLTPVVAIFFADGLHAIITRVAKGASRFLVWLLMFFFVCSFGILEVQRYFVQWRHDPVTWEGFNTAWDDLGRAIAQLPEGRYDVYVPPDIVHHPTFRFETYGRTGIFPLELPESLLRKGDTDKNRIIVATAPTTLYADLRRLYPQGRDLFMLRTPRGQAWAIGYLIPRDYLVEPSQRHQ